MASKAPYIVPAVKKHTASVIVVHGLGDSGLGWMDLAKNWRRRGMFEHIKFIFPNAPTIPITVNFGMAMPGWYDIKSFDDEGRSDDEPGITRSRDYLNNMLETESKETGVPISRMILGGFSQGGSISLFTSLTTNHQLAGFFGLSSYLLMSKKVESSIPPSNPNKDTPVFMGHGDIDPLVKYEWGTRTANALESFGRKVDFRTYKGLVHSADPQEISDLEAFIRRQLPEAEAAVEQGGAATASSSPSKA